MRKQMFSVIGLLIVLSLLAACGPTPEPQVIKETVPVEVTKEVTVKETVPVEVVKEVTVKETVPVEVTAVPEPTEAAQATFPRDQTIYVAGSAWGPPSTWNPFQPGSLANTTGTIGFLYEFLFGYDPFTGEMIPWLAESGTWIDPNTYDLMLRQGLAWSDGEPLTSADVVYTYELGKNYEAIWFSPMWRYLTGVEASDDLHVTFTFTDPLYQEFENNLFNIPIVPKHIWESKSEEDITVGANEKPIGSGAYLYQATGADRNIWARNDNWWGNDVFGQPAPKYIVDILTSSNNAALGMVIKGELDLSNNFLPGVAELANKGYVQTYFSGPPYMLAANTAVLFLNTTKAPMDDPAFRRALAFAIDVPSIVNVAYAQLVAPASPSGLLPTLSKYIDQTVMDRLGYSFDTAKAEQMLADAGYKDVNGDGMVEAPDGSTFELEVTCPNGWTDWMAAIDIIATSAQAAGINIQAATPDYGAWNTDLMGGTFDMTLNNWASLSNTPWKLYNLLFSHPVMDQMQNGNFGRYENQEIFDLVDELARVPMSDEQSMKDACSAIQEAMLTEMPMIPLWYNGMWAQWSTSTWTNWPTDGMTNPTVPTTWSGYWQLGALQTLINLKPVETP